LPPLTPGKLTALLKSAPAGAVFFVHGEEEHLREEVIRRVLDSWLDPATRDFNLDQFRGGDLSADALASLLSTPPMMAERRFVVVREAQGLSQKAREVVEQVTSAPPSGLILLLAAQIPGGSKARFYTTLQQRAHSVECAAVDPLDLPAWLVERASQEHGVTLELDAARALAAAIGSQLGVLTSELEKLVAFADGRTVVGLDDVRAVGGYVVRVDRWGWFDTVAERRFLEALRSVPDLLATGENGVGLVIGLTTQLVRTGLGVAGGKAALERELRSHQRWLANRIAATARRWTLPEIDLALEELLRTDRLLKSASLSDLHAMEELLIRLHERIGERRSAA
jgi:DNA polymerase III subunit delta